LYDDARDLSRFSQALLIFGISFLALGEERGERSGSERRGPSPLSRLSTAFSLGSTTHLPIFRYRNLEGQMVPGRNRPITRQVYNSRRAAGATGERRETVFSPSNFEFLKNKLQSF